MRRKSAGIDDASGYRADAAGIPVIVHEESSGGFCHRDATVFPQGIGLAATWNPTLVKCAGDEIVKLYYRDDVASIARPDRMLPDFARLSLGPGETCKATFTVHPSRLAFYDPHMRFVTEPGDFTFSIGASSSDIRVEKTVTLNEEVAEYRQREIVETKVSHDS